MLSRGLLLTSGIVAVPAQAETLTPDQVSYDFEQKDQGTARTCNIMLIVTSDKSPEALNFRYIVAIDRAQSAAYAAFSLDVGDLVFSRGLPSRLDKAPLQRAAFESNTFSSQGRMFGGAVPDGGVLMSTPDPATITEFQAAFWSGDFAISFRRVGASTDRRYVVSAAVPRSRQQQMLNCVGSAEP